MIEAIARQYITGSMWRDYSKVTDTSDTSNANGVAANGVAWCSTPFAMV
jgi:phosphoribosylaminoimidazole-succinocarboxamide synthase